jgi:plasmid stabilization system protein ParE
MAEPWFRIEVQLANGTEVKSEISEATAREMLAGEWRYIFHEQGLSDREKVARMIATQLARSMENPEAIFVLDGNAGPGDKWLVREAVIVAARVTDVSGERHLGFGPFVPSELRENAKPPA